MRIETDDEEHLFRDGGITVVGGCRSDTIRGISGVIKGQPIRASRDRSRPLIEENEFLQWINEQVDLLQNSGVINEAKANAASFIRAAAVDLQNLPICLCQDGWLSSKEVISRVSSMNQIKLVSPLRMRYGHKITRKNLLDDVIVVESGSYPSGLPNLAEYTKPVEWKWSRSNFHMWTLEGRVIESVAIAWSVSLKDLLANSQQSTDKRSFKATFANDEFGNPITEDHADILIRPRTVNH